jgi:hypothetical protein
MSDSGFGDDVGPATASTTPLTVQAAPEQAGMMTIRHAPLFVIAMPVLIAGLALAGASPLMLLAAPAVLAIPILALLIMPDDVDHTKP